MMARAIALAMLASAACYDEPVAGRDTIAPCDGLCVSDPTAHCVSSAPSCTSSAECGSGLTCTDVDAQNQCLTGADRDPRCRPAAFDRLALQVEFGVGGMQISIEPTPGIAWHAPSNAEFVACAVFSCSPSFSSIGFSPTGKRELKTIDNFAQCVVLFGASPASQSQLELIPEHLYRDPARCEDATPRAPVITELSAGCWAYDSTSLIAASELVHVPGTLVAGIPSIPHGQTCAHDGDACYDAAGDRFGVCLDRACTARCTTSADCVAGDPTADHCGWTCRALPDATLGACVAVP